MLDDCMTNQHRKGHARAQIIADAVHCRGCQRFWDSGRVVGLTLPLPHHGRFAVIREQSQNAVEVRRGEARLWVRCPAFASARQLQQALEVSRRNRPCLRDVVGQVFRDTSGCPHSARSHIADVNAFRICQHVLCLGCSPSLHEKPSLHRQQHQDSSLPGMTGFDI